jgi:hypothetical protein
MRVSDLHRRVLVIKKFSPNSLNPSIWLDASDLSTVISSGIPALVSQWNDKSGNSNNFSQTSSSNQPISNTNQQNSLNLLTFNGNQSLLGTSAIDLNAVAGNPFEIYLVGDVFTTGTFFSQTNNFTVSLRKFQIFKDIDSSSLASQVKGLLTKITKTPDTNRFRLVNLNYNGSSGTLTDTNVTSNLAVGSAVENNVPLRIGARGPSISFPLNGTIGEIIVFQSNLSTNDRLELVSYLIDKWNILL